jgi:hypothetical protein
VQKHTPIQPTAEKRRFNHRFHSHECDRAAATLAFLFLPFPFLHESEICTSMRIYSELLLVNHGFCLLYSQFLTALYLPAYFMTDPRPVPDDSVAIMMAFQSPGVQVLGLTTIFGNCTTERQCLDSGMLTDALFSIFFIFFCFLH